MADAPEQLYSPAFTTELIMAKVGINPVTGDVWYWKGDLLGTMTKVGTVTPSAMSAMGITKTIKVKEKTS